MKEKLDLQMCYKVKKNPREKSHKEKYSLSSQQHYLAISVTWGADIAHHGECTHQNSKVESFTLPLHVQNQWLGGYINVE
jgi:hypothetical protein